MGFKRSRFKGEVNNELICIICEHVLEDPLQLSCEHLFCSKCVNEWLETHESCPEDEQSASKSDLQTVPKFVVNIINELEISCDFAERGCPEVLKLRGLSDHLETCCFNSNKTDAKSDGKQTALIRDLIESNKELKEESKWMLKIAEKLVEENKGMRREIMDLRKKVEVHEKLISSMRDERVGNKEERNESEVRAKRRETAPRVEPKVRRGGIEETEMATSRGLFEASGEHKEAVRKLRFNGFVKSERLFDAMASIDFKNYFQDYSSYKEKGTFAAKLERLAVYFTEGLKVLDISFLYPYYIPCIAFMLGTTGSIVSMTYQKSDQDAVRKDHGLLLEKKRVIFINEPAFFANRKRGYPPLGPYDVILVYQNNFIEQKLRQQLKVGGKVVGADSGEVLFDRKLLFEH